MQTSEGIVEAIGNTPLIALERASAATGCTILGKAEFMNPGQSVKDRAARQMILEAEKRGEIKPGGLIVESTAGNTGIGLVLVANARGYRTLIVIPETQSQEKKDMLRLCGAELVEVPAVPYSPEQLSAHRPPPGRRAARQRAQRRPVRGSVEQPGQPQGALRLDRSRDLGADRGQGGRLHLRHRHRRHHRGRSELSARAAQGRGNRRCRSKGRRHVQSLRAWRSQGIGRRLHHRRHRARPRDPHHRGHQGRQAVSDRRRGGGAGDLRSAQHEGLCMGGSTGINVAGAIGWQEMGRATPSSHSRRLWIALSVEAVRSGVPARERFPCRNGSNAARASRCRTKSLNTRRFV